MSESLVSFREVPRSKVYTAIVEQILENIRLGTFPPGSALPSERLLAERLGVSRSSLREAVRVLEHAHVLDVRGGSGTYVTAEGVSKAAALRARAALAGERSPLDLVAVRKVIEPMCAELAATSHHAKDLKILRESLSSHEEMIREEADPAVADYSFHLAVAAASHNDVLADVEHYFVEVMQQRTWALLKGRSRSRGDAGTRFLEQHKGIYQAIRKREAGLARERMEEHMATIAAALLDELPSR